MRILRNIGFVQIFIPFQIVGNSPTTAANSKQPSSQCSSREESYDEFSAESFRFFPLKLLKVFPLKLPKLQTVKLASTRE